MRPQQQHTLFAPTLPLLLASICACRDGRPPELAHAEARPPAEVSVAEVTGRDEPVVIEATGSFHADEQSEVAPEASGRVVATPVDVGEQVRAGAPVARLQSVDVGLRLDEARAAVARAEANLKLAESRYRQRDQVEQLIQEEVRNSAQAVRSAQQRLGEQLRRGETRSSSTTRSAAASTRAPAPCFWCWSARRRWSRRRGRSCGRAPT